MPNVIRETLNNLIESSLKNKIEKVFSNGSEHNREKLEEIARYIKDIHEYQESNLDVSKELEEKNAELVKLREEYADFKAYIY